MSQARRMPPPAQQQQPQYSAVPTSPRSTNNQDYAQGLSQQATLVNRPVARGSILARNQQQQQQPFAQNYEPDMMQGIQAGQVGSQYGPYSYSGFSRESGFYRESRFSAAPSEASSIGPEKGVGSTATTTVPPYMWDTKDPDLDDALHNPDPVRDAALDRSFTFWSSRGWANASVLLILVAGLITLFTVYPIITFYRATTLQIPGFNAGGVGVNGSGQVPVLTSVPGLIDPDTPSSALTRTGFDGQQYNLVFSDEFNIDGRTFYPGDDPFWEAVNLHYWQTGDLEWYDPGGVITKGGHLVITLEETDTHNLNFQGGMLQSWNKLCFTTGYVEVRVSLPGPPGVPGLWPAIWSMGNLGRAGYGATTDGSWPYTYDSCDPGTYPNQTGKNGVPNAAQTDGPGGGPLSFMPGQRASACTCPGSDHPGPNVNVGRGAPEIDIFEYQNTVIPGQPTEEMSQSAQIAPFNDAYKYVDTAPATVIYNQSKTRENSYKGGVYQQALSWITKVYSNPFSGNFANFGYEYWSNQNNRNEGFITWVSESAETWTLTAEAIGPDNVVQIGPRLISEEPMYMIFNLGLSPSFSVADWEHLTFPTSMLVDYIRIYQRDGLGPSSLSCDPANYPTAQYIQNHMNAYTNPNLTTWASAGYEYPRNSQYDGC